MQSDHNARPRKRGHEGVERRHSRSCPKAPCTCRPTYQASVWSAREGRKIHKTFPTLAAAKSWRAEALVGVRRGTLKAPSRTTVREAAEAWLSGAKQGTIRTRNGATYKPSAIRGYDASLRLRVLPEFGGARLSEISRLDLQDFVDRLQSGGHDPSTIRNTLMPLRAIYRRAVTRGEVANNPTTDLELPAVEGRRDRAASPEEAAELIGALPEQDRSLWATAFYAGLRRGELQALRWEQVDLAAGRIHVRASWDAVEGPVQPKSKAGLRVVPMPGVLRDYLLSHRSRSSGIGFVFGAKNGAPFTPSNVRMRAAKAWRDANVTRGEAKMEPLNPIGLHEARHTYASLMIAAGVNAKALTSYMGHSSIQITFDHYGHLMPGSENEAAELLDNYLLRADTQARLAQIGS